MLIEMAPESVVLPRVCSTRPWCVLIVCQRARAFSKLFRQCGSVESFLSEQGFYTHYRGRARHHPGLCLLGSIGNSKMLHMVVIQAISNDQHAGCLLGVVLEVVI
jgi:hypothetical protein